MLMDRFGDTYAGAYVLPPGNAEDDWTSERPPVTARIGHMNGAYDFWAGQNYPPAPLTVRRKMLVMAASWAGVETALDNLLTATILAGESKLWALHNDGATKFWTTAKCTGLAIEESATDPETGVPVSLEFFCRESVWYGGTHEAIWSVTGAKTVTNAGAQRAQAKFTLYNAPSAMTLTEVTVTNDTTGDTWTFSGDVLADTYLIVDSAARSCTNAGASAYADLALGPRQIDWLRLAPGANTITISITPNTGTFQFGLEWTDTY